MLDSMMTDLKQLEVELEKVKAAGKSEGDKLRGDDGKLINPNIKMTLAELKEQKTRVRVIDGVKFYNQMEHELLEYIPMEMFTQNAEYQVMEASEKVKEVQKGFVSVLNYFGEDDKMTSTDFFGTLSTFLQSFDGEKDCFERQEDIRIRDEKRLAIQKEKDAKKLAATRAKEALLQTQGSSDSDLSYDTPQDGKKKKKKRLVIIERSEKNPMGVGGIAAAVAAAALKKKQKSEQGNEDVASTDTPKRPANPMGMGGIAAQVAAAALKKKQQGLRDGNQMNALVDNDPIAFQDRNLPQNVESDDSISLQGAESNDSDVSYGTLGTLHTPGAINTVPRMSPQTRNSRCNNPEALIDDDMNGISHLIRPIVKRATADDMINLAQELEGAQKTSKNSSDSDDDAALQNANSTDSNISHGFLTQSSASKPKGRNTYNSTTLRPKLNEEFDSYRNQGDDDCDTDDFSAPPSRILKTGTKKERNRTLAAVDEDDDHTEIKHQASDDSDVSYGTVNTATTVDTLQTIQSFSRKTNLAFDALTRRADGDNSHEAVNPLAGGGIAAAAAQVAMNRNQNKPTVDESNTDATAKPSNPFAGGGIAAAAAQQQ